MKIHTVCENKFVQQEQGRLLDRFWDIPLVQGTTSFWTSPRPKGPEFARP